MQPDQREPGVNGLRDQVRRRKRRRESGVVWEPEWQGRIFRLMNLRYASQRDRTSGNRTYSADVVLLGPVDHVEYTGKATGARGTITAFDAALRSALARWPKDFGLPEIRLHSYRIGLARPDEGMDSPAVAEARIRFNGREYERRVVHDDGETAMCLLLLSVYDQFCYERWQALLRPTGITPEEAIANTRERAARGYA